MMASCLDWAKMSPALSARTIFYHSQGLFYNYRLFDISLCNFLYICFIIYFHFFLFSRVCFAFAVLGAFHPILLLVFHPILLLVFPLSSEASPHHNCILWFPFHFLLVCSHWLRFWSSRFCACNWLRVLSLSSSYSIRFRNCDWRSCFRREELTVLFPFFGCLAW